MQKVDIKLFFFSSNLLAFSIYFKIYVKIVALSSELHQNLTRFDIVKWSHRWEKINIRDETFFVPYAWQWLGALSLEKWISDSLIIVIREINTQKNELLMIQLSQLMSNWLEWPFTRAVCPFEYMIIVFRFFSLNLPLRRNSISNYFLDGKLGKLVETNGKRILQVIRVNEQTLLLPWIQRIMIQVIHRYETNRFSVFRSVGSVVSLLQVSKQR